MTTTPAPADSGGITGGHPSGAKPVTKRNHEAGRAQTRRVARRRA